MEFLKPGENFNSGKKIYKGLGNLHLWCYLLCKQLYNDLLRERVVVLPKPDIHRRSWHICQMLYLHIGWNWTGGEWAGSGEETALSVARRGYLFTATFPYCFLSGENIGSYNAWINYGRAPKVLPCLLPSCLPPTCPSVLCCWITCCCHGSPSSFPGWFPHTAGLLLFPYRNVHTR